MGRAKISMSLIGGEKLMILRCESILTRGGFIDSKVTTRLPLIGQYFHRATSHRSISSQGDLASVADLDENKFLGWNMSGASGGFWLGGHRDERDSSAWRWSDGLTWDYNNTQWFPKETPYEGKSLQDGSKCKKIQYKNKGLKHLVTNEKLELLLKMPSMQEMKTVQ